MSAPTPAPGDDRPREGFYPDPSIPGYVRYWNGSAWVPGTSRPAPSDGGPLTPPSGAPPASVEETGPHFFDEDPAPADPYAGRPEPASAWGADRSHQSGFGGDQDRRVSWGGGPQTPDPRLPSPAQPGGQSTSTDGTATIPPTEPEDGGGAGAGDVVSGGTFVFRRPTSGDGGAGVAGSPSGTAPSGASGPGGPVPDEGTVTFRTPPPRTPHHPAAPGAHPGSTPAPTFPAAAQDSGGAATGFGAPGPAGPAAADFGTQGPVGAAGSGAAPGAGFGAPGSGAAAPGSGFGGQGQGAAAPGTGFGAPGSAGTDPAVASGAAPAAPAAARPGFGAGKAAAERAAAAQPPGAPAPQGPAGFPAAQPGGQPAAQPGVRASAAHPGPQQAAPNVPQQAGAPAVPQPQPAAVAAQGAAQASASASVPPAPGPGGGQPSWAQQVHRLAGAEDGPVAPWKPPVEDIFQAAARRQASARPAGLGKRLAARLVDTLVLAAVTSAAAVPLGVKALDHVNAKIDAAKLTGETVTVWLLDGTTSVYLGIVLGVLLVFGVVYEALPTAKWGRTLGKKLFGLEVRDIGGGEPPSFGAALRRWLVYSVPGLLVVGVVGVVWGAFDKPWRQCWHDKAAHTFVAG
ncbi:RDD family protein [Streptomyces sp. NBC_01485]|uniref:RDD family protein n=1 Tax=Streptomyces sp. NBC_01485 TaxID=2903884 RepID=UPI002E301AFA|nr:RDD family protein [Streptomyces sp. NBC_01485]